MISITGFSWSLDISTTNIGMALWDSKGKLVELTHLKLDVDKSIPEEIRYLEKARTFKRHAIAFNERVKREYKTTIQNVIVEEPLMHTPVNIVTTAKLLGFNAICSYILDEIFEVPPYHISVYKSRKLFCPELINVKKQKGKIKETLSFPKDVDKKVYLWNKVAKMEPSVKWHYKKNGTVKETSFDMSDAYVVGHAGLIVLGVK